jgi:hypothetical protein
MVRIFILPLKVAEHNQVKLLSVLSIHELSDRLECNLGSLAGGISVDTGRDGGKGNRIEAALYS